MGVCIGVRKKINRSHTHTDREQHPRHRHIHTHDKSNTPNTQTNTSHKHVMYIFGGTSTRAYTRRQARGATPEPRRVADTTPHSLSAAWDGVQSIIQRSSQSHTRARRSHIPAKPQGVTNPASRSDERLGGL